MRTSAILNRAENDVSTLDEEVFTSDRSEHVSQPQLRALPGHVYWHLPPFIDRNRCRMVRFVI